MLRIDNTLVETLLHYVQGDVLKGESNPEEERKKSVADRAIKLAVLEEEGVDLDKFDESLVAEFELVVSEFKRLSELLLSHMKENSVYSKRLDDVETGVLKTKIYTYDGTSMRSWSYSQ